MGFCGTYVVHDKCEYYLTLTIRVYHTSNKKASVSSKIKKNPFFQRDFSYLVLVDKPNSVPQRGDSHLSRPNITIGLKRFSTNFARYKWCKIEYPELVEGLFDSTQSSQFCSRLWRTKLEHDLAHA